MKKLLALSLALLLTLALSVTAAAETIKIGGIAPFTGFASFYGNSVREGADLYVDEVNAAGGILGKEVEIIWLDDKGEAVEASNAYNQLVTEGVSVIFGPVTSTPSLAVGPLAAKDNIVMLSPSATAFEVTDAGDNVFRTCFLDPYQAELLATFSKDTLNAEKAAVLYINTDAYSIGLYESFAAKAEELGIEIVAVEAIDENDADYTPQLIKIADAEPDVVFICYYYETAAKVLRQAVDVGLNSYMLGADGFASIEDQVLDAPELLDKAFYCDSFTTLDDSPVAQAFMKAFENKYEKTASGFNALGYDTAKILLAAIEAAGDETDRDAIKAAMKATDIYCATGRIIFDDHNDPIKTAIIQGFKDGKPYLHSRIDP